ncbi:hypothetical protein ACFZAM_31760 [Streptomyces sp. NPDC008079]|uniref:hypothetical protein n=1 Tax=Streptomyces sp. NPDC008079 TaxID=3364806 RepID=UPI0036ECE506
MTSTWTEEAQQVLPPPIKPRRLLRDLLNGGYTTSDDRYHLTPYYDPNEVIRGRGPRRWDVVDTLSVEAPWVGTLDEFRTARCAPDGVPWLVLDMDQGVVRAEPTRQAAVRWACHHHDGRVISRERRGEGWYDYSIGYSSSDCSLVWIARADIAHRHGADAEQQPWYPYPDSPHEEGPRALGAS